MQNTVKKGVKYYFNFFLFTFAFNSDLFFFFVLTNPGFGGFMEKVSIVEMKQQSGYLLF